MSAKRRKGTAGDREQGQATLEFALVITFLLLTMFGIIDFSRLFFAYATMSHGVREGARYGIVYRERGDVEAMKLDIAQRAQRSIMVIGGDTTVYVELPGDDIDEGEEDDDVGCTDSHVCRLVVVATSDLDVWTPIIPNIQIVAQSTMHFE
jgi:hypothetical protein